MKSLKQIRVRVRAALLGRIPELLLCRIPIHGTYFDKAVPKLLRRVVEVACLGTHHGPVIDKAGEEEEYDENPSTQELRPPVSSYPRDPRKPQTVPSAYRETMSPKCRKLAELSFIFFDCSPSHKVTRNHLSPR